MDSALHLCSSKDLLRLDMDIQIASYLRGEHHLQSDKLGPTEIQDTERVRGRAYIERGKGGRREDPGHEGCAHFACSKVPSFETNSHHPERGIWVCERFESTCEEKGVPFDTSSLPCKGSLLNYIEGQECI